MTQAKSVHSTPRRTAPKNSPSYEVDNLPDVYCMKLDGDCLEPLIPHGASVVLKKSERIAAGDIVCVWFHPRIIKPGMPSAWLKRLQSNIPPWVKFPYADHPDSNVQAALLLEQITPPQSYRIKCSDVIGLHKAIGFAPACEIGGSVRSDTIMPIGDDVVPVLT